MHPNTTMIMRASNLNPSVVAALLLMGACLPSPCGVPSELYLTNVVVLPNGFGQFEVRTPDTTNGYVLLYSRELTQWSYWKSLDTGTNHHVIQTPLPISSIGTVFVQAASLGQAIYEFHFDFRGMWNGPLKNNSTPALSWPQQIQSWQAQLNVDNCTNFPSTADVLFSGIGTTNEPAEDDPTPYYDLTGWYSTSILPISSPPLGGSWTVEYGAKHLVFSVPDPQLASHFVTIVPSFVASNGYLHSVSWTYRNSITGADLGASPVFKKKIDFSIYGGDYNLFGQNDYTVFESSEISDNSTNYVFSPPVEWTNSMFVVTYGDSLRNNYTYFYSFGNLYQVYGGNSSVTGNNWWEQGYDPESHSFTLLGSATNTSTFTGSYSVYVIRVPKHNVVNIDAVRGANGIYYSSYITGNTSNLQNIGGPPDGMYAVVGPTERGYYTGGFIVIDATGKNLSSITVFTSP